MYYSLITLKGKFYDTDSIFSTLPFLGQSRFNLVFLTVISESILKNKNIKYVIFEYDQSFSCTMGQLEQIYNLIKRLTVHGKKTIFYSSEYDEKAFYLSSACEKRLVPSCGSLKFLGFKRQFLYIKNLIEKIDVKVDILRRGKYKGALDIFRLDSIDEAQKEAYSRILEVTNETAIKTICSSLNIDIDYFRENIEGKILSSDEMKKMNLVWEISHLQQFINKIAKDQKLHQMKFKNIKYRFGKGHKVAVLCFDGGIKDGDNDANSIFGEQIGDRYIIKQIEKLRKNKKIKSIILKVNSGGGSATASDAIASELLELKKEKDLVVVQSGIAGSGGYYISFPGEKIFAQNTTITGSIGVISAFFNMKGLYDKFGITHSVLKTNDLADIYTTTREKTKEEIDLLNRQIERIYNDFVSNVSRNRNRSFEEIDQIAQGRVWTGLDAKKIGIVDEIGDLHCALDYIKEKYNTKNLSVEFYPKKKKSILSKFLSSPKEEIHDSIEFENKNKLNLILNIQNYIQKIDKKNLILMPELFFTDFYI